MLWPAAAIGLWVLLTGPMVLALQLLGKLACKVILVGIDIDKEVHEDRNVGLAVLEATIFVSMGLVLVGVGS